MADASTKRTDAAGPGAGAFAVVISGGIGYWIGCPLDPTTVGWLGPAPIPGITF